MSFYRSSNRFALIFDPLGPAITDSGPTDLNVPIPHRVWFVTKQLATPLLFDRHYQRLRFEDIFLEILQIGTKTEKGDLRIRAEVSFGAAAN